MRDGVFDDLLRSESELREFQDLKPKSYKISSVEDRSIRDTPFMAAKRNQVPLKFVQGKRYYSANSLTMDSRPPYIPEPPPQPQQQNLNKPLPPLPSRPPTLNSSNHDMVLPPPPGPPPLVANNSTSVWGGTAWGRQHGFLPPQALPPEIREELLQQEASDRRLHERENTHRRQQAASGGGGAIAEEMDPASFGESKDQETLRNRRTEFEDSGYGTASHGRSSGVNAALPTDTNAVERQIDDIGTEYSETSMTESRSLGYMEHFANDLYAVISKVQCDPQGIQTLSGLLPELLQQFALRRRS